jgi:hypothetical protein
MSGATLDTASFEDCFGTEEENREHLEKMRIADERLEAECVAGTRPRCSCGAPSLFIDENRVPLCAPCGYDRAN